MPARGDFLSRRVSALDRSVIDSPSSNANMTCTGNVCTSAVAGTYSVRGIHEQFTDSASATFTCGARLAWHDAHVASATSAIFF